MHVVKQFWSLSLSFQDFFLKKIYTCTMKSELSKNLLDKLFTYNLQVLKNN